MKALFGRKVLNLKELKELTKEAKEDGVKGSDYIVDRDINMNNDQFKDFTNSFCKDQPWITKEDGGCNEKGLLCIRVINIETNERILVNSEGYTYSRYVAIEE
jgi:hypothetical protein